MAQLQLFFLSGPSRKAKSLLYSCPGKLPSPHFVLAILTKPSFPPEKMHNGLNYVQITLTPEESSLGSPQKRILNFQLQRLKIIQSRHKSHCQTVRTLCSLRAFWGPAAPWTLQISKLCLVFNLHLFSLPLPATCRNCRFYPCVSLLSAV